MVARELTHHQDGGKRRSHGGGQITRHANHCTVGNADLEFGEEPIKECANSCAIHCTTEQRGAQHATCAARANAEGRCDSLQNAQPQEQQDNVFAEIGRFQHRLVTLQGLLDVTIARGEDLREEEADCAHHQTADQRFSPRFPRQATEDNFRLSEEHNAKTHHCGNDKGEQGVAEKFYRRIEEFLWRVEDRFPTEDAGKGHVGNR